MAAVSYIRTSKDQKLLLLGIIEEGESNNYTVNLSAFRDIGAPSVGAELDSSQMSGIRYTDELIRAKKKALNILAYADNNKKNLSLKLYRAGFSREIVDSVCSDMVEHGYVNEERQLERIILNEANIKLRGPMKITPALVAKGYSMAQVKSVMNRLVESGEIDFSLNAKRLLDKKLPDGGDNEEVKKILYKNGFKKYD